MHHKFSVTHFAGEAFVPIFEFSLFIYARFAISICAKITEYLFLLGEVLLAQIAIWYKLACFESRFQAEHLIIDIELMCLWSHPDLISIIKRDLSFFHDGIQSLIYSIEISISSKTKLDIIRFLALLGGSPLLCYIGRYFGGRCWMMLQVQWLRKWAYSWFVLLVAGSAHPRVNIAFILRLVVALIDLWEISVSTYKFCLGSIRLWIFTH